MSVDSANTSPIFGFLSVLDLGEAGFCGGLLLLDRMGRPVEFHCTLPVTSDRAQEILYGRTHRRFVFCDQIGRALIEKTNRRVSVVLIDDPLLLELPETDCPVVLPVIDPSATEPIEIEAGIREFQLSGQTFLSTAADTPRGDLQAVTDLLETFVHLSHITEPFERIRDAIAQAKMAA